MTTCTYNLKVCTPILLFLLSLLFVGTYHISAEEVVGGSFALSTAPLGVEDPYSGPVGFGLFYDGDRFLSQWNVRPGASLWSYQMLPRREEFGPSLFVLPSLSLRIPFDDPFTLSGLTVSPVVEIGAYFRRYTFLSEQRFSIRPVSSLGGEMRLSVDHRRLYGIGVTYMTFWESTVRHLLRFSVSFGYRLGDSTL